MEKNKKWESGSESSLPDTRLKEQLIRAKKEVDRQNKNLEKPIEGSYKEKNGDDDTEFEGLKSEPKID